MKKSIFKATLALSAMFTFGSINLQDSLETKPATESPGFSRAIAVIILPHLPTGGPHENIYVMETTPKWYES